ncbi:hypothetical protein AHF37_08755 [Paragonimus kellicotti]|nr:hypothetical protein AHF37_08755 [Paragonimus kellicotti]
MLQDTVPTLTTQRRSAVTSMWRRSTKRRFHTPSCCPLSGEAALPQFRRSMPIYLRVKRLRSETAVDSFETQRLCKISRQDAEAPSVFRYIGSQLTTTSAETCYDQITGLNKIESRGKCKLLWDAKSGKILGQNEADNVPCEVSVLYSFRFITFESLCSYPVAISYVHFLITSISGNFDSVGLSPTALHNSVDRIVFEDDRDYLGLSDDLCADDEDDSNSESNWRNDYPDEEATTESDSDSSLSSSRRRRSESSDYDDFSYAFHY